MKRIYLILIFIFLEIIFLHSQSIDNIGLIFGCNMSNQYWKWDNDVNNIGNHSKDFLAGFKIGVSYDLRLINKLFITPSILFNQKGFIENNTFYYTWNGDLIKEGSGLRLNYLTVNLPLKYKFEFAKINPFFKIGAYFDYLLSYSKKSKDKLRLLLYDDLYQDNKIIVIGYEISIGCEIIKSKKINIDTELNFNYDLIRPFETEVLGKQVINVKNYMIGLVIVTRLKK